MSEWGPPLLHTDTHIFGGGRGDNCVGYCLCQPFLLLRSPSPGCHEIFDFCGWFGPSMIFACKCAARPPLGPPFRSLNPPTATATAIIISHLLQFFCTHCCPFFKGSLYFSLAFLEFLVIMTENLIFFPLNCKVEG